MIQQKIGLISMIHAAFATLYIIFDSSVFLNANGIMVLFGIVLILNCALVMTFDMFEIALSSKQIRVNHKKKLNMKNTFGKHSDIYSSENKFGYLRSVLFGCLVEASGYYQSLVKNLTNSWLAFISNGSLQLMVLGFIVFAMFTNNVFPEVRVEAIELIKLVG